jgi:SM-20-related protein
MMPMTAAMAAAVAATGAAMTTMTATSEAIAAARPRMLRRVAEGVFVADGLFSEPQRAHVHNFLCGDAAGWIFGWKSSSRKDRFAFWHKHFAGHRKGVAPYDCADELKRNAPLLHAIWGGLSRSLFNGHALIRCYANAQSYGSDGTLHRDSKSPTSYTAVYYPHEIWKPDWAGETLVFNDDATDVVAAIYPRPNRLCVFNGHAPHVARGVSRTCPKLRVTLMFKTEAKYAERQAPSISDRRSEDRPDQSQRTDAV